METGVGGCLAIFKFIDKKRGENGYEIFALLSPQLAAKVLPLGEPAWGSCVRLGVLAGGGHALLCRPQTNP